MFLVDDLLLGPGKAAMLVFKELARKAQEDWLDDAAVKQELQEIYALVEAGKISSQEFESRECNLLERLEQIARAKYNDKWGHGNPQVEIEAAAVVAPLAEETPWQTEQPITTTLPAMKTPWLLDSQPVSASPPLIEPPPIELPPVFEPPPPVIARPPVYEPAPLPPVPPPLPRQVSSPPAAPALSIVQVVENTTRALSLLNLKLSVITSVSPEDGGWRVTAELIERRGVPDTNDLIGVYEVHLDGAGSVMRYERTRMRRRGDIGR